ncbi:MAG: IS200/IS605 family transposase [Bacteroidetes bacterium]|nr:IS200/IS605 family transposase [Bacteroidota bacterium]MCW5894274.1 IS200/IS605 family transposase [Bacteroidota bacterium]
MAHTYVQLLTHIVFSTKHRQPVMTSDLRERLFPYIGGIFRELEGSALLINGVADHVHVLAFLPAKRALSDIMRDVKANSSGWVHKQFPQQKNFAWQTGYGAFSVSKSNLEVVKNYIANQEEHHRRKTFQEEYVGLLKKHGIEYDERYIWD